MKRFLKLTILSLFLILLIIGISIIRNHTNAEYGIAGKKIGFTIYFEEENKAWIPVFEQQMDKWNQIYPVFFVKNKIRITNLSEIPLDVDDDINAVALVTRQQDSELLFAGDTDTRKNNDGVIVSADITFDRSMALPLTELDPTSCNIGPTSIAVETGSRDIRPKNIRFSKVALHELAHVIGLVHVEPMQIEEEIVEINIMNSELTIDSEIRWKDSKVWFYIANRNFGVTSFNDCGVFRGIKYPPYCPEVSKQALKRGESFTLKNVTVENLGRGMKNVEVAFKLYRCNTKLPGYHLGTKSYQLNSFSESTELVSLRMPFEYITPGSYCIRAEIIGSDDYEGNNKKTLTTVNVIL